MAIAFLVSSTTRATSWRRLKPADLQQHARYFAKPAERRHSACLLYTSAVGLLYQQGYFRQTIGKDGEQQALFPYNDPGQLPITPLRQPNGEWLRLEIALPGYSVWLRAWQVQVCLLYTSRCV